MVGPATDCLSNPLGCIRQLFDRAVANGTPPHELGASDWGAEELFASEIARMGGMDVVRTSLQSPSSCSIESFMNS